MIELRHKQNFAKFWGQWKKHLNGLVTKAGGNLFCPEQADISFTETANGFSATPKYPICLYAIRQKGTSTTGSAKLVVFIDGIFEFVNGTGNEKPLELASAHSNVAFFRLRQNADNVKLDLIDAYHFDHFTENPKDSAPHPVFHAQRNIRPDVIFAKFRASLEANNRKNNDIVDIDQARKDELFGLKTFRLPTPQIDLFSLSAILAADHLVDKCGHSTEPYESFKKFLSYISDDTVSVVRLIHQHNIRAEVADKSHRFVWQWYSRH